jgi:cell wall-associated NlpC family hydrolase
MKLKQLELTWNTLQQNITALQMLKAANEKDMAAAELKKTEADNKLAQLEEEERKIAGDLSTLEIKLISTGKSIIDDSSSTDDQLNAAITELRSIRSRIITDKADDEVVKYIEKAKSILKERKLARDRAQSSNGGYTGSASVSSSAIVNKAYQYLGVRYVWGGTTPSGFDCSGFIQYVYRSQGVSLPRTSRAQAASGKYVSIANAQPGDILYFGQSQVTHVGIYIGNGKMIHSPRPGKSVEIVSISWHVNNYRIKGARRI